MNEAGANPTALTPAPPADGGWPAGPKSDEGWSRQKMLFFIALAVAVHVALIFAFGTKKQFVPRAVTGVPQLQIASHPDELLELDNPALFALPNPRDFSSSVWQESPAIKQPSFRWKARPGELSLAPDRLGAAFSLFMQTNRFADFQLDFKPPPQLAELASQFGLSLPQESTLQVSGALAQRPLLTQPALPTLNVSDILAPSRVQVLVDQSGNVISAVLLPADNALEAAGRKDTGDTNAVNLARSLKFAPARKLAFGEVTFYWHTIPLISTNAPDNP